MKKIFLFFSLFIFLQTFAQSPQTFTSADIYLQIKKLDVLGSVLYIAAHPDDENTRLLAYFSKEKQYRTGYLSLTRGDGGQNLLGDEQGFELGLIRTQELLAARRIDGAEQFFSRAYDFGFCKTSAEALQKWNHEKILSDVVWIIRKFQPDVVITRFPPDARAGHGHHAASAILAHEAFIAAADSTKFPEQFKYGVKVWQAKRLLWNTYNFGSINTTDNNQFKMDIGAFNPLLGKGYGEIAAESRSQHKSQGFGVPAQRGESTEYFSLTDGTKVNDDLMDAVNTGWSRVSANDVSDKIKNIAAQYSFEHPENSLNALVELYQSIKNLPDGYWKNKKLEELKNIIVECSGIFSEATSENEFAVQGDSLKVNFFLNKRNNANIILKEISFPDFDSSFNQNLSTNKNFSFAKTFFVPTYEPVSQPYWLAKPLQEGSFDVSDQTLIGKTQNDAAYEATFIFTINGEDFSIKKSLQYKFTDPVKGEVYEPLFVVPAVTGKFNKSIYLLDGQPSKDISATFFAQKNIPLANIHLGISSNWSLDNGSLNENITAGNSKTISATITSSEKEGTALIKVASAEIIDSKGLRHNEALLEERKISYSHIPDIIYFKPLQAEAEKINIMVKGKNIGYIAGAGDKVPEALEEMGYDVKMLNAADISDEKLKQFDAVIAGVRAYDVDDFLASKYEVLMRYISNGGNLIVQYNRNANVSKMAPYSFSISSTRVTNENAAVHILLPNHPALNYPNKISEKDFEGWIQERSTYQASNLDSHYAALFGMNDNNEPESNGSLIIAPYGKGNFVYTGLVFFRELPAGVSGAYRLMANLIALPQNK